MSGRLAGKIALITGSSQGFGQGILETFVREGAKVLGLDLLAADGQVDGFTKEQAYQIKANVAELGSWERAVSFTRLTPVVSWAQGLMGSSIARNMYLTLWETSLDRCPQRRVVVSEQVRLGCHFRRVRSSVRRECQKHLPRLKGPHPRDEEERARFYHRYLQRECHPSWRNADVVQCYQGWSLGRNQVFRPGVRQGPA